MEAEILLRFLPALAGFAVLLIFYLIAPRRKDHNCNNCGRPLGKDSPIIQMDQRGNRMDFCNTQCQEQFRIKVQS